MYRRKEWSHDHCPICDGSNEDSDHINLCPASPARAPWDLSLDAFQLKLQEYHTHPDIEPILVNPHLAKPPGYERTPTNRTQLNQTQQKDPNVPITQLEHPARKTARQCSSPLGPHIARAGAFIGSKAMTYLSLIK
jgi:hypothetical protein